MDNIMFEKEIHENYARERKLLLKMKRKERIMQFIFEVIVVSCSSLFILFVIMGLCMLGGGK